MSIFIKGIIYILFTTLGILSLPIIFVATIILYAVEEAEKQIK